MSADYSVKQLEKPCPSTQTCALLHTPPDLAKHVAIIGPRQQWVRR